MYSRAHQYIYFTSDSMLWFLVFLPYTNYECYGYFILFVFYHLRQL